MRRPGATTSMCSCSSAVFPVLDPKGYLVWLLRRLLLRSDRCHGCPFIPACIAEEVWPRSSPTTAVARSWLVLLV